MNVGFTLVNTSYIVSFFNEQMTTYLGFVGGVSQYNLNPTSAAWVLSYPISDLESSCGTCLCPTTKKCCKISCRDWTIN